MADYAHKQTDEIIKGLEKKLKKEYGRAVRETQQKLDDYLKRFKTKDKIWKGWVASGKKTKAEYLEWRKGQIIAGKRWSQLKNQLATDYHNANKIAQKIVRKDIKDVYAINFNWGTYEIEHGLGIDTSLTLYNHDAVERIMSQNPDLLPPPGKKTSERIRRGKDIRWNKQVIQSVATQSILQGESIPDMAKRLAQAVGDSNYKSAIRNARTMCTGAENAGRDDAYARAEDMGCRIGRYWIATHDNRTRTSHRHLDGEQRGEDGYFSNGCRFPADPECMDEREIYNCRCRMRAIPTGYESNYGISESPDIMGMSYDEWLDAKPVYKPILSQSETSKSIKESYIREYRRR